MSKKALYLYEMFRKVWHLEAAKESGDYLGRKDSCILAYGEEHSKSRLAEQDIGRPGKKLREQHAIC